HQRAPGRPDLRPRYRLHGADDRLDGVDRVPEGLDPYNVILRSAPLRASRRMATGDEQHPSRLAEDGSHLRMTPDFFASSITPRRGDGVQAAVAEHMRHEAKRAEYSRECDVADAQAPGIGAERRHHRALAVAGKAASFHRAAAGGDARLGVQMA